MENLGNLWIELNLHLHFPAEAAASPIQQALMLALLKRLQEKDLWFGFQFFGQWGGRLSKMDTLESLAAGSVDWRRRLYVLQATKTKYSEASILLLQFGEGELEIRLKVTDPELEQRRDRLLQQMVELVAEWEDLTSLHAWWGAGMVYSNLPYPRLRPPRLHYLFHLGSLLDFVSPSFHEKYQYGRPDLVKKILEAPVPNQGSRTQYADIFVLQWVPDLCDWKTVQDGCSLQEQWMTAVLNASRDTNYNAAGDLMVLNAYRPQPPLSFYDGFNHVGYKFMLADETGVMDEDVLAEMLKCLKQRALPDGKPLVELILIVPSRSAALCIQPRLQALGIQTIYYVGTDGHWYNPFPPGMWID